MKRGPKPKSREGSKPGTLVCSLCKQEFPKSCFHKNKNRPNGLHPECKSCVSKRRSDWHSRNGEQAREWQRKWHRSNRKAVLDHYGHKCACCGESRHEFLAIDHTNGGGHKHRQALGSSTAITGWIIKNNFPPGFRILCHNCNNSRGWYGYCPHETNTTDGYWEGKTPNYQRKNTSVVS